MHLKLDPVLKMNTIMELPPSCIENGRQQPKANSRVHTAMVFLPAECLLSLISMSREKSSLMTFSSKKTNYFCCHNIFQHVNALLGVFCHAFIATLFEVIVLLFMRRLSACIAQKPDTNLQERGQYLIFVPICLLVA